MPVSRCYLNGFSLDEKPRAVALLLNCWNCILREGIILPQSAHFLVSCSNNLFTDALVSHVCRLRSLLCFYNILYMTEVSAETLLISLLIVCFCFFALWTVIVPHYLYFVICATGSNLAVSCCKELIRMSPEFWYYAIFKICCKSQI